jgi:hypothetical protein
MQAVLRHGAEHLRRGVSEHEPAAAVVDSLRQLQRTAADRPPCWAHLCGMQAPSALPRLVHGALTWCHAARLPALQLAVLALGAKSLSKGCVRVPRSSCPLMPSWAGSSRLPV